MSAEFELHAELRANTGKSASRRVRSLDKKIPAVVYGAKQPNTHILLDENTIHHKSQNEAFYTHILNLNVDGKKQSVVLKAIQRHPFKAKILHIDFQRISDSEKITMHIPLHFIGESNAIGVKKGGVVTHLVTSVEVSCLPSKLPEFIEVDVSGLDADESIHLSQLKVPQGVQFIELLHKNDIAIVNIQMPRGAEESETSTEAASA